MLEMAPDQHMVFVLSLPVISHGSLQPRQIPLHGHIRNLRESNVSLLQIQNPLPLVENKVLKVAQ